MPHIRFLFVSPWVSLAASFSTVLAAQHLAVRSGSNDQVPRGLSPHKSSPMPGAQGSRASREDNWLLYYKSVCACGGLPREAEDLSLRCELQGRVPGFAGKTSFLRSPASRGRHRWLRAHTHRPLRELICRL